MAKVFIDGSAGTTGLQIVERLKAREDISLIELPDELRKDPGARKDAMAAADVAFLCLPDAAAREAVAFAADLDTVIIDTSTAHRVAPGWTYGFPEIPGQRAKIAAAKRIANPGCHAIGFISLVQPLVQAGIIDPATVLQCFSLTGYSGGGKSMIASYEAPERDALLDAPRMYGLTQTHKHLPEMQVLCGLQSVPIFCPVVAPYYKGMQVTVMLPGAQAKGGLEAIARAYTQAYGTLCADAQTDAASPAPTGVIRFAADASEEGFLSAGAFTGKDSLQVGAFGNDERILLVSRFDNLGKGASGAAIQNMNIVLGVDETCGLIL